MLANPDIYDRDYLHELNSMHNRPMRKLWNTHEEVPVKLLGEVPSLNRRLMPKDDIKKTPHVRHSHIILTKNINFKIISLNEMLLFQL